MIFKRKENFGASYSRSLGSGDRQLYIDFSFLTRQGCSRVSGASRASGTVSLTRNVTHRTSSQYLACHRFRDCQRERADSVHIVKQTLLMSSSAQAHGAWTGTKAERASAVFTDDHGSSLSSGTAGFSIRISGTMPLRMITSTSEAWHMFLDYVNHAARTLILIFSISIWLNLSRWQPKSKAHDHHVGGTCPKISWTSLFMLRDCDSGRQISTKTIFPSKDASLTSNMWRHGVVPSFHYLT